MTKKDIKTCIGKYTYIGCLEYKDHPSGKVYIKIIKSVDVCINHDVCPVCGRQLRPVIYEG
jgi:hypothetical protein